MNFSKYEALLKAVDTGSFSRAAEELGYTQSGLTHMMNALEEEIGLRLIARGYYGIRPTEVGKRLLPRIRSTVEQEQKLKNEIEHIRAERNNVIRIGAYASIAKNWLPALIEQFRREMPEATLVVDSRQGMDDYCGMLEDGTIDLMLGSIFSPSPSIEFLPLWKDEMFALLPPGSFAGTEYGLSRFSGKDFLLPSKGFEREVGRIFSDFGIEPNIISTQVDDPAIVSMVEHGVGVSILTELILRGIHTHAEILPVKPLSFRLLGVAWNRQYPLSATAKHFIALMKKFTQESC